LLLDLVQFLAELRLSLLLLGGFRLGGMQFLCSGFQSSVFSVKFLLLRLQLLLRFLQLLLQLSGGFLVFSQLEDSLQLQLGILQLLS
jgi:hypothetical protein